MRGCRTATSSPAPRGNRRGADIAREIGVDLATIAEWRVAILSPPTHRAGEQGGKLRPPRGIARPEEAITIASEHFARRQLADCLPALGVGRGIADCRARSELSGHVTVADHRDGQRLDLAADDSRPIDPAPTGCRLPAGHDAVQTFQLILAQGADPGAGVAGDLGDVLRTGDRAGHRRVAQRPHERGLCQGAVRAL